MRPYQMSVWSRVCNNYWKHQDDLCYGNTKRHKKALDVMTEFIETYKVWYHEIIILWHVIGFKALTCFLDIKKKF